MRRRDFIKGIAGSAVVWPRVARAQQTEPMRRIGVLMNIGADNPEAPASVGAFSQGLAESGYQGNARSLICFSAVQEIGEPQLALNATAFRGHSSSSYGGVQPFRARRTPRARMQRLNVQPKAQQHLRHERATGELRARKECRLCGTVPSWPPLQKPSRATLGPWRACGFLARDGRAFNPPRRDRTNPAGDPHLSFLPIRAPS
jgi:hypothetical protein